MTLLAITFTIYGFRLTYPFCLLFGELAACAPSIFSHLPAEPEWLFPVVYLSPAASVRVQATKRDSAGFDASRMASPCESSVSATAKSPYMVNNAINATSSRIRLRLPSQRIIEYPPASSLDYQIPCRKDRNTPWFYLTESTLNLCIFWPRESH